VRGRGGVGGCGGGGGGGGGAGETGRSGVIITCSLKHRQSVVLLVARRNSFLPLTVPSPHQPSMVAATSAAASARESANISTFSVSQLLAFYPRERLFVHPLLWTTRHLRLFHCQFLNLGEIAIAVPPAPSPPRTPSATMHDDADEVQRYLDAIRGDHTMPRRLAACPHPITRASALFRLLRERVYCGYV